VNDEREDHPSFLKMMGLVAVSVAITILIFFGIGYALGRIFL
jgi:preprotein translocase subunit SecE